MRFKIEAYLFFILFIGLFKIFFPIVFFNDILFFSPPALTLTGISIVLRCYLNILGRFFRKRYPEDAYYEVRAERTNKAPKTTALQNTRQIMTHKALECQSVITTALTIDTTVTAISHKPTFSSFFFIILGKGI